MNVEKTPVVLARLFQHFVDEDPRISLKGSSDIQWEIHQELFEIAL
jgi:hypothetical protein